MLLATLFSELQRNTLCTKYRIIFYAFANISFCNKLRTENIPGVVDPLCKSLKAEAPWMHSALELEQL